MSSIDPEEDFLERVLLKLGLTDDSELEKVLANYLPTVLKKVNSEKTRNKVVEILSHINKRIKAQPQIKLPLLALLEQWKEPNISAFQRNFVLLYLEMGLKRASHEEQQMVISSLLSTLSHLQPQQQDTLLHMFLVTLRSAALKLPLDKKKRESFFVFANSKAASVIILDFLLDVLLFTLPPPESEQENVEFVSPGLSLKAQKRISSKMTFTSDTLNDTKEAVVEFLIEASDVFDSNDILPHFIVASCDNYHAVASKGDDGLRRYLPRLDLEQKPVIVKLMSMFQGTLQNKTLAAEERRKPVNFTTRLKIVEYFSRSKLAANFYPHTVQILFEALFGPDSNLRMKQTAMQFLHWVLRLAEDTQLTSMGPLILVALNKLLATLNASESVDLNVNDLKGTTYQAMGGLAKRMPQLFGTNIQLLRDFFSALSREETNVRVSLSEALSNMCLAYQRALINSSDSKLSTELESLLASAAERADVQSRFLAVYYSNRLFPFDHIPSRYLNLLTSHDSKSEVSAESRRGLRPYRRIDNDIVFDPSQSYPKFPQFIAFLMNKVNERRKISGKNTLPFSPLIFKEMLEFTRIVLKSSAGAFTITERGDEMLSAVNNEINFEERKKIEKKVKEYVLSLGDPHVPESPIRHYRELLEEALSGHSTPELQHTAVECALELIAYQPAAFAHYTTQNKLGPFRALLFTTRRETRDEVAKIIGLLALQLTDDARTSLCNDLINLVKNRDSTSNVDEKMGAISALGQIISRCLQRGVALMTSVIVSTLTTLSTFLTTPSAVAPSHTPHIQLTVTQSVGLIARFSPLLLDEAVTVGSVRPLTKITVIQNIIDLLKDASETNVIECCVEALANVCLGDRTLQVLSLVADALLQLYRVKQEEVHFAVGEALSVVAFGWESTAASDPIAILDDRDQRLIAFKDATGNIERDDATDQSIASKVMKTILDNYLLGDCVVTRTPASIWLLALLKHSGNHPLIVSQLSKIQRVFSLLLADTNEIVQEVAAKGLVLVYERGDHAAKETLVSELVKTLIHGQPGFKLTPDTPLAVEIPTIKSDSNDDKKKGGGTGNTYRELAAVATELNQPDLIYEFLNLSAHHSLWNSKRGAAFAAQTLATQAQSQLKSHLPKLIPKLYRSQYDPDPKIGQAMSRILKSLVDPKRVGQEYFEEIVRDLLENVWATQWRIREASCLALADLLVGKTAERIFPFLEELWTRVLKVMDDLKESVRIAAEHAFKSLSALTVRLCDPTHTNVKNAQKAVDIAIPFLLKKGLSSDVADVRNISITQISQICKVANFLLKPHIPELVAILLESVSLLEPAEFNYFAFHVEKMGIKQEDFEKLRLQISNLLPVNDTLEVCVTQIDSQNAADTVSKLTHLLIHGLGVSTKVATAQFIVHFALRKGEELKPFAPKLLHSLVSVLPSKAVSVRQAVARSIGVVAKLVTSKEIQPILESLVTLYQKSDNEEALPTRIGVAEALLELTRTASAVVQPLHQLLIPTVFLACYDNESETQKIFTEIWTEMGASLSLYHPLVMPLLVSSLESSSWHVKRQAARAVCKFVESVDCTQLQRQEAHQLLNKLLNALRGRVWSGKESLLVALAHFVQHFYQIFEVATKTSASSPSTEVTPHDVIMVVATECKRKSREYKKEALSALCIILETFTSHFTATITTATFDTLLPTLSSIALGQDEKEEKTSSESQQTTQHSEVHLSVLEQSIRGLAFRALSLALPRDFERIAFVVDFYLQHFHQQELLVRQEILRGFKVTMEKFAGISQLQNGCDSLWNVQRVHDVIELILSHLDSRMEEMRFVTFETLKTWVELKRPDTGALIVENECPLLLQKMKEVATKYAALSQPIESLIDKLSKVCDKGNKDNFPNKKPKIDENPTPQ